MMMKLDIASGFGISLLALSLGSCAKHNPPDTGASDLTPVVSIRQIGPDSHIETTSSGKEIQITRGKKVAEFVLPLSDQKKIQYWRQKWKNTAIEIRPVEMSSLNPVKSGHQMPLVEYRAPALREFIIVNESSGTVEKTGSYSQ